MDPNTPEVFNIQMPPTQETQKTQDWLN